MITEDYISFEIAKLLEEKGFDEPVLKFYDHKGEVAELHYRPQKKSITGDTYKCPTLQMAMKWLRKVHNIHIEIGYNRGYFPVCISTKTNDTIPYIAMGSPFTYEKACEAAIRYTLENLI